LPFYRKITKIPKVAFPASPLKIASVEIRDRLNEKIFGEGWWVFKKSENSIFNLKNGFGASKKSFSG